MKTGAHAHLKSIEKITRQSKISSCNIKRTHSVENQSEFVPHKNRKNIRKSSNEKNVAHVCVHAHDTGNCSLQFCIFVGKPSVELCPILASKEELLEFISRIDHSTQ